MSRQSAMFGPGELRVNGRVLDHECNGPLPLDAPATNTLASGEVDEAMRPGIFLLATTVFALAPDDPPIPPAVEIRFEQPGKALEQIFALFKGSRAADPASALANWKRATKGNLSLGKGTEGVIAALNPLMVRELATLNGAEFVIDFSRQDGATLWSFAVPKDDGTFAAFATAMALTDGAAEPPIDKMTVDRLGKAGSPLMGRSGETVVVGGSREALLRGREVLNLARSLTPGAPGSVTVSVHGRGLARSSRLDARRLGGAIVGFGIENMVFGIVLENNRMVSVCGTPRAQGDPVVTLDPVWLADVPEACSLAFSIAIDGRPAIWDRVFAAIDAVEKADAKNVQRAPIRARVGLAARLAGIDLERDLWPNLRGITGFLIGTVREPEGFAVALHVSDDAAATALRDRLLPQLAKALRLDRATGPLPRNGARPLATVGGKIVWVSTDAPRTVWIGWGDEAVPTSIRLNRPARLLGDAGVGKARDLVGLREKSRRGWFYPSRLGLVALGSPLGDAVERIGAIEWEGEDRGAFSTERFLWPHLDRGVRHFLDKIPQQPAPTPPK